jgi:hypothetical protein
MNITGSSLPILSSCQWWARPDVSAPAFQATDAMKLGTAVHAAIEQELLGAGNTLDVAEDARPYVDAWLSWWETDGREQLGADRWEAEIPMAYSPNSDTARRLPADARGRRYAVEPGEIAGTVDAIRVAANGWATVVDWKTGEDFAGLTADASTNAQLRGYALMAARAHGVENVRVVVARITPAGVRTTTHDLDALDLADAAATLKALVERVPTSHPSPGAHCRRCRAVAVCPATATATDQLVDATRQAMPAGDPPAPVDLVVTRDNAAPLRERLEAVRAACDAVEAALKAYAEANGGIALANGKTWRKVVQERSSVKLDGPEGAAALAVIDAHGCAEAVDRTPKTSQAALERAVRAQGLKGKEATAKMRAVMDEIRAAGAVRVANVDTWKET